MPDLSELTQIRGFYVVDVDDAGIWYRRTLVPPVGHDDVIPYVPRPIVAAVDDGSLLGAPEVVPRSWLERKPAWLVEAEGVRVVTEGPETGRAAGYIRLHDTCYQDGTGSCRMPETVPYHEFHRGRIPVVDNSTDPPTRGDMAGGVIALVDGHSNRAGAKTAAAAAAYMDRPELGKLRGVIVEDEHGALFLGCAREDMTRAEAHMVNASDVSGEWWPIYEPGPDGRPRLVGQDLVAIALVIGGAFRKPAPERLRMIAAALGTADLDDVEEEALLALHCDCDRDPDLFLFAAVPDLREMDAPVAQGPGIQPTIITHAAYPPGRSATSPDPVHIGELVASLVAAELDRRAAAGPLVASIDSDVEDHGARLAIVETDLTALRGEFDDLVRRFAEFQASSMDEEELTLPDAVAATAEGLQALEDRMAELEATTQTGPADILTDPEPVGTTA